MTDSRPGTQESRPGTMGTMDSRPGTQGNEGNDGFKTNYANSSQTGRSNGRSNYRLNGRSGTIDRPISVMVMTGYDWL